MSNPLLLSFSILLSNTRQAVCEDPWSILSISRENCCLFWVVSFSKIPCNLMLYRASVYLSVSRTKGKFEYQIYFVVFSFQKHACVYLQASLTDKDFKIRVF